MTDAPTELLPCKLCGNPPGQKVGPPALARCINKECEGLKLGADTLTEWNTRQSASVERAEAAGEAGALQDIRAALTSAAETLRIISNDRKRYGAIATAAQSRGWQLSAAIKAVDALASPRSEGARASEVRSGDAWSASVHDEIIKRLMAGVGMPNSTSLYTAFKQFANELHALAHSRESAPVAQAAGDYGKMSVDMAIEACAKVADDFAAYEQTVLDRAYADDALSETGRKSITSSAGSRQIAAEQIAHDIRALSVPSADRGGEA